MSSCREYLATTDRRGTTTTVQCGLEGPHTTHSFGLAPGQSQGYPAHTSDTTEEAPAMTTATAPAQGTKRCPGIASLELAAHELAGTLENFSANKSLPDGLAVRCRVHDQLYGKAWNAAKKAGAKFSGKAGAPVPQAALEALGYSSGMPQQQVVHPDGSPVFMATAEQRAEREAVAPATVHVSPLRGTPQYASELAMRADRGRAKGYSTEQVGSLIYALPEDAGVLGTPEGQAALELVNEARKAERRRADAERKRNERAAKRAREQAAASA